MDVTIRIIQFIVSLSLLVIIHELGHFLFAKMFKTRVEKFYLFFNPWFSLFKFKRGETEYGMGWLPLGGYVKISGMIDESMDTDQMKQPAQPWEFRSKPAWQRLLIMVAGVMMNLVLAIAIYIGLSYSFGDQYIDAQKVTTGYLFSDTAKKIGFQDGDKILSVDGVPVNKVNTIATDIIIGKAKYVEVERNGAKEVVYIDPVYFADLINDPKFLSLAVPFVIDSVPPTGPAAQAGLQAGDRLIAVNGDTVRYFERFSQVFADNAGKTVSVTAERDSAGITLLRDFQVNLNDQGQMLVFLDTQSYVPMTHIDYNLFQAIPAGFVKAGNQISSYIDQLRLMFDKDYKAYKSLGGFVSIAKIFPHEWDWATFWYNTAFLSIILAVMNILPIPALDGGHVLFLLYEVVTRRRPSEKFLEHAQMVGLVILLALVLFANANDIYKLFV